jgi:fibronectin type 3 domain-containing protein
VTYSVGAIRMFALLTKTEIKLCSKKNVLVNWRFTTMDTNTFKSPKFFIILILIFWGISKTGTANNNIQKIIQVKVLENQSIREISKKYLNTPDLWEDILRANNIQAAHDIKPGLILNIPVYLISQANEQLIKSQNTIREAAKAGARIFTPALIKEAIDYRDNAIKQRKLGELKQCIAIAKKSIHKAEQSLNICISKQDLPAEAVLDYLKGSVHRRKLSDNDWQSIALYDLLMEGDKVRTLRQSYAEILFKDESRIQLKENAQTLIRKIRNNLLNNTQKCDVSVLEGEVLAFLTGTARGNFHIDTPGVETRIHSKQFWIKKDKKKSRIANYDGTLKVSSGGSQVLLNKNEGTVVPLNKKPSPPTKLIQSPNLIFPTDSSESFTTDIRLRWEKVPHAIAYKLELSFDKKFSKIIVAKTIKNTFFDIPKNLNNNLYFWRIASISKNGFMGMFSDTWSFSIIDDSYPPYLVLHTPENSKTVTSNSVFISGNTEPGITLTIDDYQASVDKDGNFSYYYHLNEGNQKISVKAVDHAGNETIIERNILCIINDKITLSFDRSIPQIQPFNFVTRNKLFSLSGNTLPDALLTLTALESKDCSNKVLSSLESYQENSMQTIADSSGHFSMNIPTRNQQNSFALSIQSQSGETRLECLKIQVDKTPPIISFKSPLKSITNKSKINIQGMAKDAISFCINEKNFPLNNDRFNADVNLKQGNNLLRFESQDLAGNISVIEKKIILDQKAPRIKSIKISPRKIKQGERVYIEIFVNDETTLTRVAPYEVKIDSNLYTGYLLFSKNKGKYETYFKAPNLIKGIVHLVSVEFSDYLGNRKKYNF